jgi:predicted alpha/beta superfamily hydrolase
MEARMRLFALRLMIVVGIKNTDRNRDMTPSRPAKAFGGAPWTGSAGGADKFLAFIAGHLGGA